MSIVYIGVSVLFLIGLPLYLKKFGGVLIDRHGDMKRYANQLRVITLIGFIAFFAISQLALTVFMDEEFMYGPVAGWINIILVIPGFMGFMIAMYRLSPMFLRVEYENTQALIIENIKKAFYAILMTLNYFIYVYALSLLIAFIEKSL